MRKYQQGFFHPKNPLKYRGKVTQIIFRSSWELKIMNYLDKNDQILWWGSEELPIPYISPLDHKQHRYFVDFIFRVKEKTGEEKTHLWEIKPFSQTQEPKKRKKTKRYIQELSEYAKNLAKWEAATKFCEEHNLKFSIITEREMGL
jgi:hypothetical protein